MVVIPVKICSDICKREAQKEEETGEGKVPTCQCLCACCLPPPIKYSTFDNCVTSSQVFQDGETSQVGVFACMNAHNSLCVCVFTVFNGMTDTVFFLFFKCN